MSDGTPRTCFDAPPAAAAEIGRSGAESRQMEFTIGELSREFDITLRSLRFYEDKGLLTPRRAGTSRIFSRRDRARLQLILLGKRVGLSLQEIKELLDVYDAEDGPVRQLRMARRRFDEQIVNLEVQIADLKSSLRELRDLRESVDGKLATARPELLSH